jgi:hypothetical protein
METLFGCNSSNIPPKAKEMSVTRKPVFATVEHENRVLDPKKSQNIAILLRALNVTRDEVSEALLDGKFISSFIFISVILFDVNIEFYFLNM